MNSTAKLQPDAEDDELKLEHQAERQGEQVLEEEEEGEKSGVFTSAPSLQKIQAKLDAEKAFYDEIRSKNGYSDRKAEALEYAHKLSKERGDDAGEKYLAEFEKEEEQRLQEIAQSESEKINGVERFDYEHEQAQKLPEDFFTSSLEGTKQRVLEVIKPLKLDAGDLLTNNGKTIIEEKLGKPFNGIVYSGSRVPVGLRTQFKHGDVFAISSPGLQKKNGEYPENRDGFVVNQTKDGLGLNIVMSHGVTEGPEAAALANAASVSAAYDLSRMHPPRLSEVLVGVNDQVNGVKKELDIPKQRLSLLGVTVQKGAPESPLYQVDVVNAGDVHCFVVNTFNGHVEQTTPATVSGELQNEHLPMAKRKELLGKYAQKSGATVEQIERTLVMSAGMATDYFKPLETNLTAAPGEIVVVASADFMRSIGGAEFFQDGTFAKMLSQRLKEGQKLGDILTSVTKNILRRQKEAKLEDFPVSIVAFEVPGAEFGAPRQGPELTLEEVMARPLPLDLDFSDLEKPEKD